MTCTLDNPCLAEFTWSSSGEASLFVTLLRSSVSPADQTQIEVSNSCILDREFRLHESHLVLVIFISHYCALSSQNSDIGLRSISGSIGRILYYFVILAHKSLISYRQINSSGRATLDLTIWMMAFWFKVNMPKTCRHIELNLYCILRHGDMPQSWSALLQINCTFETSVRTIGDKKKSQLFSSVKLNTAVAGMIIACNLFAEDWSIMNYGIVILAYQTIE